MLNVQQNILKRKLSLLILVFFLLLNFVTTGGHLFSIDDVQYFLHAENVALNGSIKIDPTSPSIQELGFNEHTLRELQQRYYANQQLEWSYDTPLEPFFTATSPLVPVIVVPLYYLAVVTSSSPISFLGFFTNSIILSLTSFMIFWTGLHFFRSQRIAFILSLVYLVTTFVWPYNTGMMLRPLAGLMFLLGFYMIVTSKNENYFRPIIAGSCIGLGVLASVAAIILLPGMILFGIFNFHKNKKQILLFLIGISIFMIIQAILNEIRFGSFTDFGFGFQQDITAHLHIDGIIGYIFSIGWGVLFNAPLLVLFPPTVYLIWKKNRILAIFLSYSFFVTWIFHGTEVSPLWSGYGGWGPRYFIIILPLLILSIGFLVKEYSHNRIFKVGFIGLGVFGFFVNLMGKLVWYMYAYSYGWGILKTPLLANSWEQINYNIQYAPITLHIMTLISGYIQSLTGQLTGGISWGLAPCPYDLFVYCEIGIIPIIIMLAFVVVFGFLILKNLQKVNLATN